MTHKDLIPVSPLDVERARRAREAADPVLRLVCAWCDRVLRDGAEPTTHGICPECKSSMLR